MEASDKLQYINSANVSCIQKLFAVKILLNEEIKKKPQIGESQGDTAVALDTCLDNFSNIHHMLVQLCDNMIVFLRNAGMAFLETDESAARIIYDECETVNSKTYIPYGSSGTVSPNTAYQIPTIKDLKRKTVNTCAVPGLIRDFSDAQLNNLVDFAESITPTNWWEKVLDRIDDNIQTRFGVRIAAKIAKACGQMDFYHQRLIDLNNITKEYINSIFELERHIDARFGSYFSAVLSEIQALNNLVQAITDAVSGSTTDLENSLANIDSLAALLGEAGLSLKSAANQLDNINYVGDEEVRKFCTEYYAAACAVFSAYSRLVGEYICDIDMWDVFLIALVQREGIISETFKGASSSDSIETTIKKMILNGQLERDIVGELSEQTGYSREEILEWLKTGKLSTPGYGIYNYDKTGFERPQASQLYEQKPVSAVNGLFMKICSELLKDDNIVEQLAEHYGISTDAFKSVMNGDISGYQVYHIQKQLASELESLRDDEKFSFDAEWLEDNLSILSDLGELNDDKYEIALNNRKGRNITAAEYKAAKEQYKALANILKAPEALSDILAYVKKGEDALNFVAGLLTDYSSSIEAIQILKDATGSTTDPNYITALSNLEDLYSDKFHLITNNIKDLVIDKAGDYILKTAGEVVHLGKGPTLYSIVTTCLDLTAKLTSADTYTSALVDVMSLQGVCIENEKAYQAALDAVHNGDTSAEAMEKVRTTFAITKKSYLDAYKAMYQIEESSWGDAEASNRNKALLKIKIAEIEQLDIEDIMNNVKTSGGDGAFGGGGGGSR